MGTRCAGWKMGWPLIRLGCFAIGVVASNRHRQVSLPTYSAPKLCGVCVVVWPGRRCHAAVPRCIPTHPTAQTLPCVPRCTLSGSSGRIPCSRPPGAGGPGQPEPGLCRYRQRSPTGGGRRKCGANGWTSSWLGPTGLGPPDWWMLAGFCIPKSFSSLVGYTYIPCTNSNNNNLIIEEEEEEEDY
ncbi:hypothetical protein F4679DRAFT_347978 [Xylaria curta]|nr:hypothetical protein F4679DRAFT_347978 [Xylaria curta]